MCRRKSRSNVLLTCHVILPTLFQHFNKPEEHIALPITLLPAVMASTTGKRSTTDVAAAKRRRGRRYLPTEEQQLPPDASFSAYSDICTYWAAKPAFDPQRVLLRRLFFLNANETKYVSVGFYPARDSLPLVEFGVIRRSGFKVMILTY